MYFVTFFFYISFAVKIYSTFTIWKFEKNKKKLSC